MLGQNYIPNLQNSMLYLRQWFFIQYLQVQTVKKKPVSNCMYCNLEADYNIDFSPDRLWKQQQQQQQEKKQTNKHSKKYPTIIKMQGGCKENHEKTIIETKPATLNQSSC